MIKLYDDQKLEIIKELKKYYVKSIKSIEELKESKEKDSYTSLLDLDKYEKANAEIAELIKKLDNDINSINDKQWLDLFLGAIILFSKEEDNIDKTIDKENWLDNSNSTPWWGIIGLIAVAAIFGGNDGIFSGGNPEPEDNKNLN